MMDANTLQRKLRTIYICIDRCRFSIQEKNTNIKNIFISVISHKKLNSNPQYHVSPGGKWTFLVPLHSCIWITLHQHTNTLEKKVILENSGKGIAPMKFPCICFPFIWFSIKCPYLTTSSTGSDAGKLAIFLHKAVSSMHQETNTCNFVYSLQHQCNWSNHSILHHRKYELYYIYIQMKSLKTVSQRNYFPTQIPEN